MENLTRLLSSWNCMDEFYMEALRFVNRIRRKHGKGGLKKLRKGRRRSSCDCPISNSLKDLSDVFLVKSSCGAVFLYTGDEEEMIELSPGANLFVSRFDDRECKFYP